MLWHELQSIIYQLYSKITALTHFLHHLYSKLKLRIDNSFMIKKQFILSTILFLLATLIGITAVTSAYAMQTPSLIERHVHEDLYPVNNSGINGFVDLIQRGKNKGTHITIVGFGLIPQHNYVSLYYGNHECALEPYSADDVIARYAARRGGIVTPHNNVKDNLDEINSVSIRDANTFQLLACADVHPK